MSRKNQLWEPGQSGNPKGRPKGTGRPVSALRSTLNKLKKLEDKCIENISLVVNGENINEKGEAIVNKEQVDLSVKIVNMIQVFHKGALAEEQSKIESRNNGQEPEEENTTPKTSFSTTMKKVG